MQILMYYVISLQWIHFETWAKIKLWFVVVGLLCSIAINLLTVNSSTTEWIVNLLHVPLTARLSLTFCTLAW